MNEDFHIQMIAPQGVAVLEPYLGEFPFPVAIAKHDQSKNTVLVQSTVSAVAGFLYEGCEGDTQFYGVFVLHSHPGEPEEVVKSISAVFQRANLTHRIARIIHELNTDEEIVSYEATGA